MFFYYGVIFPSHLITLVFSILSGIRARTLFSLLMVFFFQQTSISESELITLFEFSSSDDEDVKPLNSSYSCRVDSFSSFSAEASEIGPSSIFGVFIAPNYENLFRSMILLMFLCKFYLCLMSFSFFKSFCLKIFSTDLQYHYSNICILKLYLYLNTTFLVMQYILPKITTKTPPINR